MEHLSKQQIVLLTLLVSFVTSIATGIVTVSLMDQAPTSVTQTITQVVEKTIEKVASDQNPPSNLASVNSVDQNAAAVEKALGSIVRIKPVGRPDAILGFGIVVSSEGVVVTDKSVTSSSAGDLRAVFSDGQEFPIRVIQSQIEGDIVFAAVLFPPDKKAVIKPAAISSSIKLGQTVMALSEKDSNVLVQGIIEKVPVNADTKIDTSIPGSNLLTGSPLFNSSGEFIGIKTVSLFKENTFYSLNSLKGSIPAL